MGEDVTATVFSREDRQRYRDKVKRNLDVFARMLRESRFDAEQPLDRARDRAQPDRRGRRPGDGERRGARADRRRRVRDRARRSSTSRSTSRRALLEGEVFDRARAADPRQPQRGRGQGAHGRRAHDDRRHPADARRAAPARAGAERQPALRAAQRADLRGARGGPAPLDRRRRAALRLRRLDRPRGRVHERAAAPARPSRATSRAHWNAAQAIAGVQLAVGANSPFFFGKELWRETRIALFEQATDTRPEELKAQGVRPRVWFGERWITSIFDLFEENVRYFPALLPLCDDEDPVAVLERGDTPTLRRAQAPQRHRLPLEPARSTRSSAGARTCAWRTACCPPARRSSTCSPTPPSTTGWSARWWRASARSGRRCRSRRRRTTCTRARATGSTRASTGPASATCPVTELVLRRLLPLAHEGLERYGVDPHRARPAARDHRAPLRGGGQRRDLAEPARSGGSTRTRGSTASRRCGG